ncbi:MAG: ATP-dependent sacrificial sulfur transferase LarE [Candidatus Korobacteraceae bacterium]|jgi:uncharacterized protein
MPLAVDLSSLPVELQAKWRNLEERLRCLGKTLVAFSGGVDSAFLAWAAHYVAPGRVLALLADSPSLARSEMREAVEFCRRHDIPLQVISTDEMQRPEYVRNDSMRCFHCKDELFTVIERRRDEQAFDTVAYGINLDDQGDYRPGQQAARRHGVAAPLLEAGFTKQDVRDVARAAGLEVWDKPASACLSSRIEYGREVTVEALRQVEAGEEALRSLGFRQVRVRHHGAIARVEIARDELPRALSPEMAAEFTRILKALGFTYVTLDLEGFRSGSMNAILPAKELQRERT